MENWKCVEDPQEFHFIFMILYSYINLHIAIDGGILRYPSTEHVLLPSLHSLLIIYDHPQSHLWRRRATWHRTATLATNYTTFIISTFCAPALKLPIKIQFLFGAVFYTIDYSFPSYFASSSSPTSTIPNKSHSTHNRWCKTSPIKALPSNLKDIAL